MSTPELDPRIAKWKQVVDANPQLISNLTPRLTRYIPVTLSAPQAVFLLRPERESLYGGAAGGGKSIALIAGALQYVDIPGYAALLLRRTLKELELPGGLLSVGEAWLRGTDARWDDDNKTWTFPSGATLTFGYLDTEKDKERYQGSAYQYIGFDEAAHFEEDKYTYLMSRLRRPLTNKVPLRMRLASNPGGVGHNWLKRRFMTEGMKNKPPRSFIPAKITDNPFLDQESYIENLMEVNDPIRREQLLNGNWDVAELGDMFRAAWFQYLPLHEFPAIRYIRFWDLSAQTPNHPESDWTVGALVGLHQGRVYIKHIARMRGNPGEVETFVRNTAAQDGRNVTQYIEQEGGSSGVNTVFNYETRILKDYNCKGWKPKGNKVDRARVWAGYVQKQQCYLPLGAPWLNPFLEEVQMFPTKKINDDQVDAAGSGVVLLLQETEPRARSLDLSQTRPMMAPSAVVTNPQSVEAQLERERIEKFRHATRPVHLQKWD